MNLPGPIILLDDDPDDHDVFNVICERLGVRPYLQHYNNGFDLLKYLKTTEETPFVILCDINMPHMGGMEVRHLINEDSYMRSKAVPFIFFSTAASPDQVKRAFELTVQGFFIKGNTYEETEKKFRLILEYWMECRHPNSGK